MAAPLYPYGEPRKPYGLAPVDGSWIHVGNNTIEHAQTKQRVRRTAFGWACVPAPVRAAIP